MYRAFRTALEKRCDSESLPKSVFCYEEPDKGHEITNGMLNASMDFLKKHLI